MLYTNLNHIETAEDYHSAIAENQMVVIICGRMGEYSIPVYRTVEILQQKYSHVKFFDAEFDNPEAKFLCNMFYDIPEAKVPFLLFFENGVLVYRTWGTKSENEFEEIINHSFISSH